MKVYIRTSIGMAQTYCFDIQPSTKILEMKRRLQDKTGDEDDLEQTCLVLGKKKLEDEKTLLHYNIREGSVLQSVDLHSSTRSIGFTAIDFVDVRNTTGLVRNTWSQGAPPWRMVLPGLCLEGLCQNSDCDAYNEAVVIPVGYRRFNIISDADETTSTCPQCKEYVEPTTCGFSNCWWRYEGKQGSTERCKPPKKVSGDWTYADDAYHRFEEKISGKVPWRQLILEAVEEDPRK